MKTVITLVLLISVTLTASACPVCERNQPKLLRGLVHGAGPESQWDYIIIGLVAVMVLITIYFSLKWLVRPGEASESHIKRTVLKNF
ncbi:hypothetical protein [Sphingobacterium sp. SYP-B4668]|uniref:hypothetical protein n=1 Tax=Sphingobacterium sp. SYP-B4668 TaxID=2996035 RepID=UPI0022DDADF4|nr:hypothetical protein [Sphingobacterium sp. SYP-B4668]